jgi:PKD repeat protein
VGSPVRFSDASMYGNTWPAAWSWDFGTGIPGDTSGLEKPSFTYHSIGAYNIIFTVVNNHGCKNVVEKPVSVGLPPEADFEFTPGCVDAPVYFTDRSQASMDPIGGWEWNFGDQYSTLDTARIQNPSWSYSTMNEKMVELVVFSTGGCPDTVRKWIDIHPNPVAGFEALIDYGGEQGRVALQDASEGAQAYFWDFGDGYSLYDDYPPVVHDYEQEGSFLVEQVVWNEWGCTDTLTKEVEFMLKTLYIPNALNPDAIDPEVRVFKPKGRNLMAYRIGIYNGWGELIWESTALDAEGRPAESWDGTYEGHLVPTDVYVWKAEAVFRDGTVWEGSNTSDVNQDKLSTGTSGLVVVVR